MAKCRTCQCILPKPKYNLLTFYCAWCRSKGYSQKDRDRRRKKKPIEIKEIEPIKIPRKKADRGIVVNNIDEQLEIKTKPPQVGDFA